VEKGQTYRKNSTGIGTAFKLGPKGGQNTAGQIVGYFSGKESPVCACRSNILSTHTKTRRQVHLPTQIQANTLTHTETPLLSEAQG